MQTVPAIFVVWVMQQLDGPVITRRGQSVLGSKRAAQDGCILLPMQMSDVY